MGEEKIQNGPVHKKTKRRPIECALMMNAIFLARKKPPEHSEIGHEPNEQAPSVTITCGRQRRTEGEKEQHAERDDREINRKNDPAERLCVRGHKILPRIFSYAGSRSPAGSTRIKTHTEKLFPRAFLIRVQSKDFQNFILIWFSNSLDASSATLQFRVVICEVSSQSLRNVLARRKIQTV
ncbi:hypothetical protein HUU05_14410 [candidate division KSB1 bacterium]|nr:hypothetical protein [candidate division KSB1 bacterium]